MSGKSKPAEEEVVPIEPFAHHSRQPICGTRSRYRCGRRGTAVKVMTISDESKYLLIHGVPDIKCDVKEELRRVCDRFGAIDGLFATDYPTSEEFTKVFLINYKNFANAVKAKKSLDDRDFLGSVLHVCYAPERETIDETRDKLRQRRRYVSNVLTKGHLKTTRSEPLDCHRVADECGVESPEVVVEKATEDKLKRKYSEIPEKSSHESQSPVDPSSEPKRAKLTPKIRWRK
ncbi:unnamed protein product [Oppiella nova]|uniref:RNA-binding protein 48 n=1 Tax=Oppiella nova TaxID=334625 RepID=A0A7R9QUI2_9ACAR|nr:unnamed protein product [Oppiella nova]CAG2174845.1 unnamed protein product [Oppiella nova]